jgi:hypothetical protein
MNPEKTRSYTLRDGSILLLLTVIIFFPLHLWQIAFHDITDYATYNELVRNILSDPKAWSVVTNLPGWPLMAAALAEMLSIRVWKAAFFTQMSMQTLLALVLFFYTKRELPDRKTWHHFILPLGIMLAAPVFLIAPVDRLLYFGYLGINSSHNPTIIALKSFAVLIFFITADNLNEKKHSLPLALLAAGVVLFSTLIKPSYIICLLPAAGIYAIIQITHHHKIDLLSLVFSTAFPAILVLLYQFLATYNSDEIGIIFSPLTVMRNSSGWLLVKFILSIWFPLLTSCFYHRELRASTSMLLAWLTFAFGASYSYLLAEGGWRIFHGNFVWSGEISNFVLFAAATFFFFKQRGQTDPSPKWKRIFWGGFLPHILCGVIYYAYCILNNRYF